MFFKTLSEEDLENYRQFFLENDYVLLKDILTEEGKKRLNTIEHISLKNDLIQFSRSHSIHNYDKIVAEYVNDTIDVYKKIIGEQFFKTYAFGIQYKKDNYVNPHLDLITNEVSSTTCYYSEGEYPLYISSDFIENNYNMRYSLKNHDSIPLKKRIKINICCGDVGIFNGRNHLHWRETLKDDINYRAILSHYSYTVEGTEEYFKKLSENVPHENGINVYYPNGLPDL